MATETKPQELARLVRDYQLGERQNRQEAWNLIADFAVANWNDICRALEDRDAATVAERKRCADILQLARHGEIDGDLRSIIHRIESGAPAVADERDTQ